jgi:hypothetical protein
MWQDLSPFLSGGGPTAQVLAPNLTPTTILSSAAGGSVEVGWSFTGSALALLGNIDFTATVYADPFGPPPTVVVDAILLGPPTTIDPTEQVYNTNIPIPPGLLPVNTYSFTVVITAQENQGPGGTLPIAGFVDIPFVAVGP